MWKYLVFCFLAGIQSGAVNLYLNTSEESDLKKSLVLL